MTMVKSQTVLEKKKVGSVRVVFEQTTEAREEMRLHAIGVDRAVWDEMGEPDVITITIEPGDKLNEGAS